MARVKHYLETDVLTEARARLRHTFEIFDTIAVMFSGGKDSLAVLHLTREIAKEFGQKVVNVVFRDEELIPDPVIDFVDKYRRLPWVNMTWYAYPLKSTEYVLGVSRSYVQWDPKRRHVRQAPPWALTLPPGDERIFDQYNMDAEVAKLYRGKIACVTGIRASESLMRFRASVNKLNENYLTSPFTAGTGPAPANIMLCKPLYDWEENDVFKFFMEHHIEYCPLYDAQMWANVALRVSTPLHAEASKRFDHLKLFAPMLYQQVIDVFPEMRTHERYYGDMDKKAIVKRYGETFEGVREWIIEFMIDEKQQTLALDRLRSVMTRARKMSGAYPPPHVLKQMMSGAYKREILPMGRKKEL
jgi:predicted phosphoadenosine phosphosulfate sulfurtransferase